ncbi:3240_t:CDS:2 [Gigaspora margarita]|uniref:3240_t:CDS:1 n=1 Tax=Gigaspora margarita TaxID=4874 RepID=A0ABN7V413_GIGMA|nr:3240_t:CDS:2 [Gigaspora margarita]
MGLINDCKRELHSNEDYENNEQEQTEFIECVTKAANGDSKYRTKRKYVIALEKLKISTDKCLAIEDSRQGVDTALGAGLDIS